MNEIISKKEFLGGINMNTLDLNFVKQPETASEITISIDESIIEIDFLSPVLRDRDFSIFCANGAICNILNSGDNYAARLDLEHISKWIVVVSIIFTKDRIYAITCSGDLLVHKDTPDNTATIGIRKDSFVYSNIIYFYCYNKVKLDFYKKDSSVTPSMPILTSILAKMDDNVVLKSLEQTIENYITNEKIQKSMETLADFKIQNTELSDEVKVAIDMGYYALHKLKTRTTELAKGREDYDDIQDLKKSSTFRFKSCDITNLNKLILSLEQAMKMYGESVPVTVFNPRVQTKFCIYAKRNCNIEFAPYEQTQPMDNIECALFGPENKGNYVYRLYVFLKKSLMGVYDYTGREEIRIGEDNDYIAILANPECVYIIPNNMFLR